MICIKTEIPQEICDIDDELKAIYHSKDTVCIWVFKTREDRNRFMEETVRRQNLVDLKLPELRETLAHQVVLMLITVMHLLAERQGL